MTEDQLHQLVIRMETLGHEPDAIYTALAKRIDPQRAMAIVRDVTGWGEPINGGRTVSQATREKLSAALKGKRRPQETKDKIRKTLAGRQA